MAKEVDKGGRPEKYKPEYNEQARKLCLLGYTDKQLADFFNVTETTINNWKHSKDGFFESIKNGKDLADGNVVESAYNRAKGMRVKEQKLIYSETGESEIIELEKDIPPDPTSFIFWLTNRQSDNFKRNRDDKKDDTQQMIEGFKDIAKALKGE